MSLDTVEIPVPRLHKRSGGLVLSVTLAALTILSATVALKHLYLLRWMSKHDKGYADGFEIEYFSEKLYTAWLPTRLHRGPHHQLAIGACAANIVASMAIMTLFLVSARAKKVGRRTLIPYFLAGKFTDKYASPPTPKNFGQHKLLLLVLLPVIAVDTTALLYAFVMHGVTGRLDTLGLYRYASPTGYAPYGVNWMDFESWSCGVRNGVPAYATRDLWDKNCRYSQLGRWLLLPLWFLVLGAALAAWFAFRGLIGWRRAGDNAEYLAVPEDEAPTGEVRGLEGRLRLN
ncbi:hypothetical protein F5X99DRAFT_425834 [Biscogniauxia marginata]|nr:hypothetical protein F5X99DRAFT_425834 [Biscogniauxia marginata]